MMNLQTSCAELARAIRGVVADAAQAPVEPQGAAGGGNACTATLTWSQFERRRSLSGHHMRMVVKAE